MSAVLGVPATDTRRDEVWQLAHDCASRLSPLAVNVKSDEMALGFSRSAVKELGLLGLFAAAASEKVSGTDTGLGGAVLVAHAFGRELLTGPWLEQMVAVMALDLAGAVDTVPGPRDGFSLISIPISRVDWKAMTLKRVSGSSVELTGVVSVLGFGEQVDEWLIPAHEIGSDRTSLVTLQRTAGRQRDSIDPLFRGIELSLDGYRGEIVGFLEGEQCESLMWSATAVLAGYAVGAAERVLSLAVEHAATRQQFGRPIGTFQAIKHTLANMFIEVQHVRSLVFGACRDEQALERTLAIAAAKVAADELLQQVAENSIQVYGGLGFTWEVPVHHFLKVGLRQRDLPASGSWHRRWIRSNIGLEPQSGPVNS